MEEEDKNSLVLASFVLGSIYGLFTIIPLANYIRTSLYAPRPTWTIHKLCLLLIAIDNAARTGLFFYAGITEKGGFFARQTSNQGFDPVFAVLEDFPTILFFSTYSLLLFFWAGVMAKAKHKSDQIDQCLRPSYIIFNVAAFTLQGTMWFLFAFYPAEQNLLNQIDNTFFAALALISAVGFLYYGISLFQLLRGVALTGERLTKGRKSKLWEVALQTAAFTVSFCVRCAALIAGMFNNGLPDDHKLLFAYFTVVELIPCAMVLYTLRKIPTGHVSRSTVSGSVSAPSREGSFSVTATPPTLQPNTCVDRVSGSFTASSPLAATNLWYQKNNPSPHSYGVSYGYGSFLPPQSLARGRSSGAMSSAITTTQAPSPAAGPVPVPTLSQSYAAVPRNSSVSSTDKQQQEPNSSPVNINGEQPVVGSASSPMGMPNYTGYGIVASPSHPALSSSFHDPALAGPSNSAGALRSVPSRALYPSYQAPESQHNSE